MSSVIIKEIAYVNSKQLDTILKNDGVITTYPDYNDGKPLVTLIFKDWARFCILEIDDLLKILELWIKAEEVRYPREKGYLGRKMLLDKILEVFLI